MNMFSGGAIGFFISYNYTASPKIKPKFLLLLSHKNIESHGKTDYNKFIIKYGEGYFL